MGYFMKEHDIYIGTMLDELNLRFAPSQGKESHFGGIDEMVALQKEFKIFKKGRSFKTSCAVLNLGARNNEVKNRWHNLLGNLSKHDSNVKGQHGDAAIVAAVLKNLASKAPLPVHFTSHDMRGDKENAQVKITDKTRPIHYLEQDFLTISLPMQPLSAAKKTVKK
jgi:mRNA-degrading endonuclease YafQ of YafQ-DinJ toxin-antitoxin module